MRRIVAREDEVITIGIEAEDKAVEVVFPVANKWRELYGDGSFIIACLRPTEEVAYTILPIVDDNDIIWVVEDSDVDIKGYGVCRLVYADEEGTFIAKSKDYRTFIYEDKMRTPSSDPPPVRESWWDDFVAKCTQVQGWSTSASTYASNAALSESSASASALSAQGYAADASNSAEEIKDMSVTSSTLEAGSEATVTKSIVEGHVNLAFGIPKGEAGGAYELPVASENTLGGIKVGERLNIDENGVLNADEQGGSYTLPTATASRLGGIKVGDGLSVEEDGTLSATGGGGGEPSAYLKSVSVSGNTATFTKKDNTTVEYTPEVPSKTSDLTNDSGFIDKSVNNLDNYTKTTSLAEVATSGDYDDLSNKPSVYTQSEVNALLDDKADVTDVSAIEAKIPTQASSSNQLADKNFVNSSIGTNTANYISNQGQPFTSVAQLEAYSGTVTNNDYAFVTGTDSDGNTYFDRYKATVSGSTVTWAKEYRLNNSSFTAAQWESITSGITSGKVALIDSAIQPDDYASASTAGVVKVGANLSITDGVLSADAQQYTLPTASASTKGGVKVGDHLRMNGDVLSADGGIYVGDTEPADVDVWIDTSEEGADFCYVGDTAPTNDGSVAVWVDTSEKAIKTLVGGEWNNVYDVATTSSDGLMSSEDKTLLDNSNNYSTSEQVIGTWIDNKPLYRKVFTFTPDSKNYTYTHNIPIDSIVSFKATKSGVSLPVLFVSTTDALLQNSIGCWITQAVVRLIIGSLQTIADVTCIVEYTKTTD